MSQSKHEVVQHGKRPDVQAGVGFPGPEEKADPFQVQVSEIREKSGLPRFSPQHAGIVFLQGAPLGDLVPLAVEKRVHGSSGYDVLPCILHQFS